MTRVCILAGNLLEAKRFAYSQGWSEDCWFFPRTLSDLIFQKNFHVLVIGTAGQNVPSNFFEKVYKLALERGKVGRI